jgi:hypothetical protein
MPRRSGFGFGRSWVYACVLVVGPRVAWAAPPDADEQPADAAEQPANALAPVDIPPTPERVPIESVEAPAPVEAPVPVEAPAAEPEHEEEHHAIALPNPKIPATGNTQMWFRSTSFVEYFGNNYDPNSNNDRFYAFVNYLNFGSDSRLKKGWQISTMVRVDTHNVFNTKTQPLCDVDNSYPIQTQETIPDPEYVDDPDDPNDQAPLIPNPRYDAQVVENPDLSISPSDRDLCNFGGDYRIERIQLRFGNKYVEVTAGDFNVNFGRGMALSIRKIADIGFDATVKGGRVDVSTKYIDVSGVAGVANRQQTDFATRQLFRDPGYPHALCEMTPELARNKYGNQFWTMCSDIVSGGRFDAKLPGKVRVGGHYVFWWFGQLAGDQHEGMHLVGGDITRARIAKHWDLFGGVTGLMRNPHHKQYYPGLVENGIAAYLSNSLTFGDTFVLLEGKYYDNYTVAKNNAATTIQYAEAPTLELPGQIIPAASNTAGARLLVEHTLKKSRVTLYGNYLGYAYSLINDENMFDPNVAHMLHHGYVGLRWRDLERGSEVQALGGYRWEGFQRASDEHPDPYSRKLPHAEFYVNQVVGKTRGLAHSLSLRGEWRYEKVQKGGASAKEFHRGNLILGYGLTPFFVLALIGGYSSEFPPLEGGVPLHEQPCDDEANCQRKPHLWPGAELRVNFLESSFIRIFGGRQVGGLLCVNGSCRNLPDFEGMRIDLVLSF